MEFHNSNLSFDSFINIPKLELHAHLNGSLSQNTLLKLIKLKQSRIGNYNNQAIADVSFSPKSLTECFKLFELIHDLMDSLEAIYMATCDVIKDFYNDGVYYLELRTTPKAIGSSVTEESYVETVIQAINTTLSELNGKMFVKLILSVDRKRPLHSAEETIKIAEKYYLSSQSIVGIDLSGNPSAGDINEFLPLLEHAKKIGLKLAFHIAEVPNGDKEVRKLLNLQPHRLGHGTFLHPSKGGCPENFKILNELKIPLEICLSSNVICKTVPSYEDHHFPLFKKIDYPCIICTDDKGVFNTCLSKEYSLASLHYSLSQMDLYNLSYKNLDYMFSSDAEKQDLRDLWRTKYSDFLSM